MAMSGRRLVTSLRSLLLGVVELDIGGQQYTVARKTLQKSPKLNELLFQAPSSEELFLDRDGSLFKFILEYLQDESRFHMPADPYLCLALRLEAVYFGLPSLKSRAEMVLAQLSRDRGSSQRSTPTRAPASVPETSTIRCLGGCNPVSITVVA
ncbi:unnamed protein product [Effrenium voratum]|uniref:BTB domain-containing protein n=1 Tax=Effrenium voratum TaxID=2562239 RepID=A0AA36J5H5_9DINO|nr:unnamed protein product [Effrenium voratum]CAJ1398925.1 unnamed protein product [Effrenium voratum]CAJ1416301.1 unnamed protein product [Effrenium voratum]|mmetsp:Transcript_58881/g.140235  ORF Transcript_58881/g.140235 Transcript_58881/m.140235 type:complete len:153 (+) Transcript_58881:48-506(+)|eukprot:CAMPEP_0181445512 /NCGR_PEP_ID=MMETSP1110-20121109/25626_1 /TAXON_ID=174948 /ORGANISM="Symbiodinium sp., Strain CCMP421" /LENGTH=152 /DNA_ID=CAMNT_0023569559 /DNA_START=43 /DNA_END=501 /DNA_ORIENTATION=+